MENFEKFRLSPLEQIEWPTTNLHNAVKELQLPKNFEIYKEPDVPLAENAFDVTKDPIAMDLAIKHRPTIDLRGLELRSEKNSRGWGGLLYRVIVDNHDITQAKKCCIQYVQCWTEQGIFLSRWYHVFAPLMLALIGIWIFSLAFPYVNIPSGGDLPEEAAQLPPEIFDDLMRQGISLNNIKPGPIVLLISTTLLLMGIWGTFVRPRIEKAGNFVFANSTIFLLYAPIFAWILFNAKNNAYIFRGQWEWHSAEIQILGTHIPIRPILQMSTVYLSSFLFILIAIFSELMIRLSPSMFHLSHEMDYAPVFVYLKRDNPDPEKWKFDKLRVDRLHYYIGEYNADKVTLQKRRIGMRPYLNIDNKWHSFDKKRNMTLIYYLEAIILIVLAAYGVYQFLFPSLYQEDIFIVQSDWTAFVVKIIPFICFLLALHIISSWPTTVHDKENLIEHRYHLDKPKLNILWSFENPVPRFIIRKKLQDPFNENEDFWVTFRDE